VDVVHFNEHFHHSPERAGAYHEKFESGQLSFEQLPSLRRTFENVCVCVHTQ
jgi:hypothetical protein